ncbi:hypothetical protein IE4771_CH03046 [Rhizobium etli bv. mimosae str. IE4771]|uniref:Uncharacterized protein n=2 Tax=Rhizobium etli TaxID=29449 RepID=A0A060I858_RHIET|nr:hypothetical protein IE4771_CH03046 [Rhizobium sp. IE4771]
MRELQLLNRVRPCPSLKCRLRDHISAHGKGFGGSAMEVTVRIQEGGLRNAYCIVEGTDGHFLIYRNHAVAADAFDRMQKSSNPLPLLTRDSREIGLDWFGPDARSARPGRRVLRGWEFTLDGNNDRVQAHGFQ